MSPSNSDSGLAGENPGLALLRNGGTGLGGLRFQQLVAESCFFRGLLWVWFFFFLLLMLKKLKYLDKWSISIGKDFISHSFCFAFLDCLNCIETDLVQE